MSTYLCPAGHQSSADDYCDTCGLAIGDGAAAPTPTPGAGAGGMPTSDAAEGAGDAPGGAGPNSCPNCDAPSPPSALFCENCGYDFTTGALPRPASSPPAAADAPDSAADSGADTGTDIGGPGASSLDLGPANPSPAPTDAWVAEIWIDPDWYADQQSTDPLPSPGMPIVQRLEHTSLLVGRASRSRGIHPDIDLSSDTGISRRHCQITTDGQRWFVEDLDSSNGTYIGGATGSLPTTPIPVGQRTEIKGDDRLYLGAWTRIVIRRAAPGEV